MSYIHLWAVSVVEHHVVRHDPSLLLGVTRQPRRTHANTWQEMQIFFEMTKYFLKFKAVSYLSSAAPRCARGRWPPRWSPRAPAPSQPRRGSCTCRGRLLQCHPLLYSICGVEWSFIQNCVDIYIYLCKYDIPCIAAPGQPSAQIKNKKYLLRPKLFTGTTREVSLPPPPYPSIKTK